MPIMPGLSVNHLSDGLEKMKRHKRTIPRSSESSLVKELGDLRSFTTASLATNDHDGVEHDRLHDRLFLRHDR